MSKTKKLNRLALTIAGVATVGAAVLGSAIPAQAAELAGPYSSLQQCQQGRYAYLHDGGYSSATQCTTAGFGTWYFYATPA